MTFLNEGTGGDKALFSSPRYPSSFTAINSPSSAQPAFCRLSARDVSAPRPRQHNPAVAEYLGLDVEMETPLADPYCLPSASASGQPPKRTRQRVTEDSNNNPPAKPSRKKAPKRAAKQKSSKQRQISDELRATKPVQFVTPKPSLKMSYTERGCNNSSSTNSKPSHRFQESCVDDQTAPTQCEYDSSETILETEYPKAYTVQRRASIQNGNLHRPEYDAHTPEQELGAPAPPAAYSEERLEDDLLDDDIDDADLLTLAEAVDHIPRSNATAADTSDSALLGRMEHGIQCTASGPSSQFVSLPTVRTPLPSPGVDMKPIVRSPFPTQVRDRSPIVGLTPNCVLRTCFRVGEALNAGRYAMRNGKSVMIELYARVLSSTREGTKQRFVLCDLFHSKPPYLKAEYDAAIWQSVPLHEFDSRVFLDDTRGTENKMCRCILTAKNNGNKDWVATMLNIWPAKKEDILWVEGIVNA